MGQAAAHAVAEAMRAALARQAQLRMAFAAAPSQNEFLAALASADGLDWSRVVAFQLDEYIGLPAERPQRFARYLRSHLFDRVQPRTIHLLDGNARGPEEECARYAQLLGAAPLDIACMGIGQNGHVAFDEPSPTEFSRERVRIVKLDERSRAQQVEDGCFDSIDLVPRVALTLTVTAIMSFKQIYCIVPGVAKAHAVRDAVRGSVTPMCPASILQRHAQAVLYLDRESAAELGS